MLTDENFGQIRNCVLQELPRVLEQEPPFFIELEKVIREEFEGQEEFAGASGNVSRSLRDSPTVIQSSVPCR